MAPKAYNIYDMNIYENLLIPNLEAIIIIILTSVP